MGPWTQNISSQFIDWMSPAKGKSWVDIGCGNGAFTTQIIEKCAPSKVEGIDPADGQIEYAKNRALNVPVNFQTGDAMALPYATDSFDIGKLDFIEIFAEIFSFFGEIKLTKSCLYFRCNGIGYIFCT